MSYLTEKIKTEPVLVTALVQAVIVVAASFGLDLTPEQSGGIVLLSGALLAFVARSKVSPVNVKDPGDKIDGHDTVPAEPDEVPFPG